MIQTSSAWCWSHCSCWELESFDMNKPSWLMDFGLCGDEWMGLRPSVLCHSLHLFQNLYFFLSAFKPVPSLQENYTLNSFFSTYCKDQAPYNTALRRYFLSPGGRWRGHSSVRPTGGFTIVTWKTLRCSQAGWAKRPQQRYEYENCQSLPEIQALLHSMAKLPMTSVHQV